MPPVHLTPAEKLLKKPGNSSKVKKLFKSGKSPSFPVSGIEGLFLERGRLLVKSFSACSALMGSASIHER
ncbi:hypothetical protein A7K91_09150 [Paenibacillus oryzae]|uniref:Uncharacterized protein n=1 Tax=Paenibacillus oryzae TaxID=1844972 RepID=A0A1A5YBC7_9BACL|nr:hypothetical protein A7K91_09150 [Paenibacillus oryzae]